MSQSSILLVSSSDLPQNRVSSAELSKHRHYDKLCSDAGLSFNACGFSMFGGAAPDAQLVLRKIKRRIAEIHGQAEGDILGNRAAERIVVFVMRGVAAQLIEATSSGAAAFGQNDPAAIPLAAPHAMRAPCARHARRPVARAKPTTEWMWTVVLGKHQVSGTANSYH